ncbi:hypothetical protein Cgig2_034062 [Carnegiea gigantea]|uniref:Uncharacterized protein n=1 Tax=Carnegiea gigantea TaxID=171969 RepID=A0A9Q1KLG4_9CARY|nr:hypothetical protein Cgig2_034062 [Carnegiea gigantea]
MVEVSVKDLGFHLLNTHGSRQGGVRKKGWWCCCQLTTGPGRWLVDGATGHSSAAGHWKGWGARIREGDHATMYITLENLRNMARPKRIISAPGGISRKDNINVTTSMNMKGNGSRIFSKTIENFRNLECKDGRAPRKAKGSIQLRGEQNYEKDNEYHLTDDERVQAECDDVPFDTQRTTMHITSLERQVIGLDQLIQ